MYLKNCPKCYGDGYINCGGKFRKCGYCSGKKKISSDFIKWEFKREKYKKKIKQQLEILLNKDIDNKMNLWDKKYNKPLKFKRS